MSSIINFPTDFSREIAREAALLVQQAYAEFQQTQQGQTWTLQGNYTELGRCSADNELFGFVAQNNATRDVFVVFRGTQTPLDWISNFTFPHASHKWGNVERGFSGLYQQCSRMVLGSVQKALNPRNLYTTGHSLGGALSSLAAADLALTGASVGTYNFASPRVGDPDFAGKFNASVAPHWRVVNTEDIVTTVPLATATIAALAPHSPLGFLLLLSKDLNYEHVGEPVSFTEQRGSITANHDMALYLAQL
jgi:predicted lipase